MVVLSVECRVDTVDRSPHVLGRVVAVQPVRAGDGERVQSVGFGDLVVVLSVEF